MMELGVEGMHAAPGYSYDTVRDQKYFLGTRRTASLFRDILETASKELGQFNHARCFLNS